MVRSVARSFKVPLFSSCFASDGNVWRAEPPDPHIGRASAVAYCKPIEDITCPTVPPRIQYASVSRYECDLILKPCRSLLLKNQRCESAARILAYAEFACGGSIARQQFMVLRLACSLEPFRSSVPCRSRPADNAPHHVKT